MRRSLARAIQSSPALKCGDGNHFDVHAAREAAVIRAQLEAQGQMIGPYDVLLAGQAKAAELRLVTHNTAEFERVQGLQLEDWQTA